MQFVALTLSDVQCL